MMTLFDEFENKLAEGKEFVTTTTVDGGKRIKFIIPLSVSWRTINGGVGS
jgi:hypothetical protein